MSEPMKVSDTPAAASTPIAADARSGKKRILLFSLLASPSRLPEAATTLTGSGSVPAM